MSAEIPVVLVDASNTLRNLGRPLSKVQDPVPTLPPVSTLPGKTNGYGEVTRAHRSVSVSDAGERFSMGRFQSELFPIPGPICDTRNLDQVFGYSARYDGRNEFLYEA